MEPTKDYGGICVICGKRISPEPRAAIAVSSERYPKRTYQFFAHPACLREVAKPGFVGIDEPLTPWYPLRPTLPKLFPALMANRNGHGDGLQPQQREHARRSTLGASALATANASR